MLIQVDRYKAMLPFQKNAHYLYIKNYESHLLITLAGHPTAIE